MIIMDDTTEVTKVNKLKVGYRNMEIEGHASATVLVMFAVNERICNII